jgi:hypothetical protein
VYYMWEPWRLTALWAFTACYSDSFTFFKRHQPSRHRPPVGPVQKLAGVSQSEVIQLFMDILQ